MAQKKLKKDKKEHPVSFRFQQETVEQLRELAEADDRSSSSMMAKLIKDAHQKLFKSQTSKK